MTRKTSKAPISIGTDITDVARIRKLIRNEKFLRKIYTPEEIRYCSGKKLAEQHFAVRFAAKEAVWKALNPLTQKLGISHREIGVRRAANGSPSVALSTRLRKFEPRFSLSLSHTREFAIAVAVFQPL